VGGEGMDYILRMVNIEKTFPGVKALDKVTLEVMKGEVHVLLGENGAGKSTLMKILTGIYQKDSGYIEFKGKKVDINNPKQAQVMGISIIYQEFNLIPHLSIAENVFLGREAMKKGFIDHKKMIEDTKKILDSLGVDLDPETPVKELGVAQQQMVEIAKALSVDADIIVMDEPTAALTDKEIDELFKSIKKLKARGVSVIYISHRLKEIKQIGDRATVLRDGQYIGTVEIENTDLENIIQMMVGRQLKDKFPKIAAQRGDVALELRNVSRKGVLHDISLKAYRGEVLGIAGLMGAGRTELARVIFGADLIDSGEIYIDGEKVNIKTPHDAINKGIGFLTEDRKGQGLVLGLGVRENITLANLNKMTKKLFCNKQREKELSEEFVEQLNIKTPGTEQKVRFLSGGNQQKVVLAKWLCTQCNILIFDEPTRGIDVGAKVEIYKLMNQLVQGGKAVLMISSELPEILGMSDRILVMHEGRITGEFMREEATQEKIMKCATGGVQSEC
jgi:ribose transport system ATP-binding protein